MTAVRSQAVTITLDDAREVSGLLQTPPGAGVCHVLAHGAGAGMSHPFMADVANGLAERRIATLRYQFPYMEQGSKRPDAPKLAQIARGIKIAKEIESLMPDRIRAMLVTLLSRVDIRPDCVEISVRRSRLVELLGSDSIDLVMQQGTPNNEAKAVLTLTVRARLQRVGRKMKMLVENTDDQTKADPGLLRIVARAYDIQERLMQDGKLTLHAIASQEHVTPGYISRLLRLPSLAPDIVTAIINGKNPPQLTAKKLMRLALEIPVDWTDQRKLFGFHAR